MVIQLDAWNYQKLFTKQNLAKIIIAETTRLMRSGA